MSDLIDKPGDDWGGNEGTAPPEAQQEVAGASEVAASADQAAAKLASLNVRERLKKTVLVDIDKEAVEVRLSDPNHPLYSAETFEHLAHMENTLPIPESVLKGLNEAGFSRPSPIQAKALPLLLKNPQKSANNPIGKPENLVFQAQAGTGKTGAFAINILSRCDPAIKAPQAFICSPTFPLAVQLAEVMRALGKYTNLEVALVYSDGDRKNLSEAAKSKSEEKIRAQIVVGTVGKIEKDITKGKKENRRYDADQVRVCVFDEADDLFDKNFHDQTSRVIRSLPATTQIVLLSATFPKPLFDFALTQISEPVNSIVLPREDVLLETVKQHYVPCKSDEEKFKALELVYETMEVGQAYIFVPTRAIALQLGDRMIKTGHKVLVFVSGGDMTKDQQAHALKSFLEGTDRVLICTNILARGIDAINTSLVVNYDIPVRQVVANAESRQYKQVADPHVYAQRIGRAGRMGRKGTAISLVSPVEEGYVLAIEKYYGRPITKLDLSDEDKFAADLK